MGHAFPDKNFESARAPCPGYESYNKLLIEHGTVAPALNRDPMESETRFRRVLLIG